ncbi:hypothetical protein ABFV47_14455 [Mycolicibacterium fortuitum]
MILIAAGAVGSVLGCLYMADIGMLVCATIIVAVCWIVLDFLKWQEE